MAHGARIDRYRHPGGMMRSAALIVLLACMRCSFAAGPVAELDVLRDSVRTNEFAQALEPRAFVFPQDHGPHPLFRHEWWYFTGNLDAASGERYGFELTFFRFALAAPRDVADPDARTSKWRTQQIYVAHFAITDVARGEFRFAQKYSRQALGLAGAQSEPFRVWLDDWTLEADSAAAGHGGWQLHAQEQDYELTLAAEPLAAPVLNGEQGLSRKSAEPGAASYYYSIPRIAVRGQLVRAGRAVGVQGLAWLDREWGSGALGQTQQGWDWFALQLKDGSALMFYALRKRDGSRDSHSAGTWVDAAGKARALSNDDVQIDVIDYWSSPRGGRYPARWRLRVPAVGLDVEAQPILKNQELATRPRYWEGAVDVTGNSGGALASGRGYVELVGYGE
jgi:predicted secreted hydrolase